MGVWHHRTLVTTFLLVFYPSAWPFQSPPKRNGWNIERTRRTISFQRHATHDQDSSRLKTPEKRPSFSEMLQRLQDYHDQHGHVLVDNKTNPDLWKWTTRIRHKFRHLALNTSTPFQTTARLEQEQLQALVDLNFVWNVKEYMWKKRFDELCLYRAQHGHLRVPASTPKLGVWVQNQRKQYRILLQSNGTVPHNDNQTPKSYLTRERLEALMSIGFLEAYIPHEVAWEERFRELQLFVATHGHAHVPIHYVDNAALGKWILLQRSQYKRYLAGLSTTLTPTRIQALNQLGMCWNSQQTRWFQMLKRLQSYKQQHGHLKLDFENYDLKVWLLKQRHEYNRFQSNQTSQLSLEKIQAIQEAIPDFEWKAVHKTEQEEAPSVEDWAKLFDGIRERGIEPGMRPKSHWFEGQVPSWDDVETKDTWTEEELMDLWNQEQDEYDEEDEDDEF